MIVGVLDINFGATPFRSLVYDGNAHFKNLAKMRKLLLTRPLRIRENTHSVNAFGKAMAFLRGNSLYTM